MPFNKEQSLVYYKKTDLLYNLVKVDNGIAELHLNCPHINSEQIISVSMDDLEMVEDAKDPFNPSDYGFIPYHVYKSEQTGEEWIEDWDLTKDGKEYSIYLNGFLFYIISVKSFNDKQTIYFGRIPSKTEGDIIMRNLGFKKNG